VGGAQALEGTAVQRRDAFLDLSLSLSLADDDEQDAEDERKRGPFQKAEARSMRE